MPAPPHPADVVRVTAWACIWTGIVIGVGSLVVDFRSFLAVMRGGRRWPDNYGWLLGVAAGLGLSGAGYFTLALLWSPRR
jgi:hypothetical protein